MSHLQPVAQNLNDFSKKAIRREVVREGLTHWLTLYPGAIGLPLGLAAFLFNLPILYLGMITSLTLSFASAIITIFFRHNSVANRYLANLSDQLKKEEELLLKNLVSELQTLTTNKIGGEFAQQAVEQSERLLRKFENVRSVLDKKLRRGELAYGRFIGAAEQVYLSGLENLKQVTVALQSLGSIDPDYISFRLKQLDKTDSNSGSTQKERETLEKRKALMEEQMDRVNMLLANNEEAMTTLEETTAAIAAMRTESRKTDVDYETAIRQLQEVAERAYIYNKH